jgi:UDP-glucose 4-epimerase
VQTEPSYRKQELCVGATSSPIPRKNLTSGCARSWSEAFFYSSSACVYSGHKKKDYDLVPLKEEDAYPAQPEDGYGWEKLFSERMCHHFHEDYDMEARVARFHNVYGPLGTWAGGREKSTCCNQPEGPGG